jgi:hypothetical protein
MPTKSLLVTMIASAETWLAGTKQVYVDPPTTETVNGTTPVWLRSTRRAGGDCTDVSTVVSAGGLVNRTYAASHQPRYEQPAANEVPAKANCA